LQRVEHQDSCQVKQLNPESFCTTLKSQAR
jgi:hypothetical protein